MKSLSKYVLIGIFALLLILVFLILKPFLNSILASLVIAYLFYPLYKFSRKWLKNKTIAALAVSIIIVLLFTLPLFFITNAVSTEARINYVIIKKTLATGNLLGEECGEDNFICGIVNSFEEYLIDPQIKFHISNIANKATEFFLNAVGNFVFSIPIFLLNFVIVIFIVFYLLKEGDVVAFRIKQLLPLKKVHKKSIFDQLNDVTYAVLYGHIMVAGIQGILGIVFFWIFGVSSPILWGMIMFFFALVPFLGTPIIWVPAVIFKAFANHPLQALGLLIAGLFISTIDNIIKPRIIAGRARIHPVIVLLGVLGGLYLFGMVGIIVGPVVLSIFITFIQIYEEEELEA